MKTIIFLAAGLGITLTAQAQSSVTLYGTVDDGFQFTSNQKGERSYAASQGGLGSSKWGLLGNENLGGGYSAVFNLENGFDPNSGKLGNNGALFGRKAFVGISSPYGTIRLGRQYDLSYETLGAYAAPNRFDGGLGAHPGDVDNLWGDFNISNAVKYTSPNLYGFTFGALYGFGNNAGDFTRSQTTNFVATYATGPFSGSVGYLKVNDPGITAWNAAASPVSGQTYSNPVTSPVYSGYASAGALQITTAGASYTIGSVTIAGVYSNTQFRNVLATSTTPKAGTFIFNSYEGNASWFVTPSVFVAAGYTFTGAENARYQQINVGARYFLSKRTYLYLTSDWLHASGVDSTGKTAVAASNNITASSGNTQLVARVGIRHQF
jgi:Outer membrane protein (porin)